MKAVIFDFGRTIYDRDNDRIFPELPDLLESLSKKYKLAIVSLASKGDIRQRLDILESAGIKHYFDPIIIVTQDKDGAYNQAAQELNLNPIDICIVDDRTRRGIAWGNKNGATTIWFKNGKFAHELPDEATGDPKYTISSLTELQAIL